MWIVILVLMVSLLREVLRVPIAIRILLVIMAWPLGTWWVPISESIVLVVSEISIHCARAGVLNGILVFMVQCLVIHGPVLGQVCRSILRGDNLKLEACRNLNVFLLAATQKWLTEELERIGKLELRLDHKSQGDDGNADSTVGFCLSFYTSARTRICMRKSISFHA